jgi:hypothetical protein
MLSLLTPPHGILFYIIYRNIQQYNIGGEYINLILCGATGVVVLFAARRERKILVSTGRDLYHISDSRTTGV